MATIAVFPFQWAGNMNTSFALARKLVRRGHRVHYVAVPDAGPRIRDQGFAFTPMLESIFPEGHAEKQKANQAAGQWPSMKEAKEEGRRVVDALCEGELERVLHPVQPDLLLITNSLPWLGVAAWRKGLPAVMYSSNLISPSDPLVPPLTSELTPGAPLYGLRTRLAWQGVFAAHKVFSLFWDQRGELRRLAQATGYPLDGLNFRNESFPRLLHPELVCCPPEFDLPRAQPPANAHFVEASVDEERKDMPFPWERLAGDKPLVYAAVGSMASTMHREKALRFIRVFLEAMASRPHLQGVLATGTHLDVSHLPHPDNVVVVPEAPQLELLGRARLMVTHGGLNSVKEAISRAVPMVVMPLFFDHFGYATRIAYHGLGARVALSRSSGVTMGAAIDEVLDKPSYVANVKAMAERFRERDARAESVDIIERTLEAHAAKKVRKAG